MIDKKWLIIGAVGLGIIALLTLIQQPTPAEPSTGGIIVQDNAPILSLVAIVALYLIYKDKRSA
jgi:hypothetical protein